MADLGENLLDRLFGKVCIMALTTKIACHWDGCRRESAFEGFGTGSG
jgi:hypothetical protein